MLLPGWPSAGTGAQGWKRCRNCNAIHGNWNCRDHDACGYARGDAHADALCEQHNNHDSEPKPHSDDLTHAICATDTDVYSPADTHGNAHADSNIYTRCDTDGHRHLERDGDRDAGFIALGGAHTMKAMLKSFDEAPERIGREMYGRKLP